MKPEDLTDANIREIEKAFAKAHPILTLFQTRPSLTNCLKNCPSTDIERRWIYLAEAYQKPETSGTLAMLIRECFESAFKFSNIDGHNRIPSGRKHDSSHLPYTAHEVGKIMQSAVYSYFFEQTVKDWEEHPELYDDSYEAGSPRKP